VSDTNRPADDDADRAKSAEATAPEAIDADDPHKTEKLTKLGHEGDPDEGSE
jgi:hypothetical protein